MHHVMLHKSSENVDVTYKVDVKFNVIGPRMKSGCIASSKYERAFRSAITSRIRYVSLSHDVLISINLFCTKRKKSFFERRRAIRIYRCARRKAQRALLFIPGMRNRPVLTSVAKCAEERAIYVRSRSTALPEKSAQGAFWITVLQRYSSIYTPVNRILQETGGVYTKN